MKRTAKTPTVFQMEVDQLAHCVEVDAAVLLERRDKCNDRAFEIFQIMPSHVCPLS